MTDIETRQVIVVDDNAAVCRTLARLLTTSGYDTMCLDSGEKALEFFKTCKPSLVLLDVMMPYVDGFDVLRAIRAEERCAGVAVIMYSALDDREYRERALELGADDYIVKGSMSFDLIEAKVKLLLSQRI